MLQGQIIVELEKFEELENALGNMLGTEISFTYKICQPKDPFCKWCSEGWREVMPDKESGVYIFQDPKGDIIYIGKATQNNLGSEIWGKFKKSRENPKEFYQSPFLSKECYPDLDPEIHRAILEGNIYLTILTVDPPHVASLLEVYLQTIYHNTKEELPVLNRRIG